MTPLAHATDTGGAFDRLTIAAAEAARAGRALPLAPADLALARRPVPGARNIIPPSPRSVAGHLGVQL